MVETLSQANKYKPKPVLRHTFHLYFDQDFHTSLTIVGAASTDDVSVT